MGRSPDRSRFGGVVDNWSKLELGWHVATTANHRLGDRDSRASDRRDRAANRAAASYSLTP